MFHFALGLLLGIAAPVALYYMLLSLERISKSKEKVEEPKPTFSESEKKEFDDANEKASQDFLSSIAALNEFMSGNSLTEDKDGR